MLYFLIFIYTWLLGLIIYSSCNNIRLLSYFYFLSYLILTFFILTLLNKSIIWYQIIFKFYTINYLDISYIIGIDGISIYFILLCSFIITTCSLLYWYLNYQYNFYSFILFFSLWILINVFGSIDLFFFLYFFWRYSNTYIFFNRYLR